MSNESGIFKITNPDLILRMIPLIEEYVSIVKGPGIYASAATTFFVQTVASGMNSAEIWAAYQNDGIVGFARWQTLSLPYLSDVVCDALYLSGKPTFKLVTELMGQFVNFGIAMKAKRYHTQIYDSKVNRVITKILGRKGVKMVDASFHYSVGGF